MGKYWWRLYYWLNPNEAKGNKNRIMKAHARMNGVPYIDIKMSYWRE